MAKGLKYDHGKPPYDLLTREFLEGAAKVLAYGANKYTRYGECDCALSVKSQKSEHEDSVKTATTNGLSEPTHLIGSDSSTTTPHGSQNTESSLQHITKEEHETIPQKNTASRVQRPTECSMPDANSAENLSDFVSTTTTNLEECVGVYASHAMLGLDGSKKPDGTSEHSPTCASLKAVSSGKWNWASGLDFSKLFAATQRHLWAWHSGEDLDPESGLPHLDHALCEMLFLRTLIEHRPDLDDRFHWPKKFLGNERVASKKSETA